MRTPRGFVSYISTIKQDIFGPFGKLATLWFDDLVIQVPRPELLGKVLDYSVGTSAMSRATADELARLWRPIQSALPGYEFLKSPWEHENASLVQVAQRVAVDATRREHPGVGEEAPGFIHEVSWAGAGLIDTIGAWAALNSESASCLLADDREAAVINDVFGAQDSEQTFACFSDIASSYVPDWSSVSWDRIAELRHHEFVVQFRKRVADISSSVRAGAPKTAAEMIAEVFARDLEEIARLARPAVKSALLKAFVSNLPLPSPINPLSVGLSAQDVREEFSRRKRFGWLYFVLDLKGAS